ncbi:diadenylate cyclase [Haloarchaeobius sp. HME9146]|uniref:diadenylate cyclase n=1 Tax=Haloarchaeobius sp. HME9146 TaxID=2978732 RepID=UPI0026E54776|nr:diadenylate cyclase [Haloarchaeobius sp. HME9146]
MITGPNVGQAEYATLPETIDILRYSAESLSLNFTRWDERYVTGPSLYFIIVADIDFGKYTDPLGDNTWPVKHCPAVTISSDEFINAARNVAFSCDGAVVIAADRTIQEQLVRVRSPSATEPTEEPPIASANWMGTKHLSALEISLREEVLAAVTLSEENGRVTTFRDGKYNDFERDELGGRWRIRR